ncbi:MAG: protein phosphatase 2C domain-containing protein, partial [Actinomycetia bacterium]|nr:protein phosphatase 2C domain-containing protein [Actinomycetes bacterium]
GMGGHEAGEVASKLAVEVLKQADSPLTDTRVLKKLVMAANVRILEAPRQGIGRSGMGTTLTAAVLDNERLLIAQVGDSRAYLLHRGLLRRLTSDHSYVQELVDSGELTESETRHHPSRSVITRVLGNEYDTEPDLYELRLEVGDRLLLCSDGLNSMLEDAEIQRQLIMDRPPEQCADALVLAANQAGGLDNITVVVIDVLELAERKPRREHRLLLAIIAFVLTLGLLIGAASGAVWWYASRSAFLIAENGQVVVYRGLVGDVLGIHLQWKVENTGIPVNRLTAPLPERLEQGIQLGSLADAEALVSQYREQLAEHPQP